ncbi:MAG: type III pantothenate kinase [Candidatus Omnitrophica bacterium]|nr:type III pantothenate kinase [Candidatus Omnitrophota bacterium]
MIVAIDIGNTAISFGLFHNKNKYSFYTLRTEAYSRNALRSLLRKTLGTAVRACIFCSVVPSLNAKIRKDIRILCSCPVYMVGKDIKITIKHRYTHIRSLGADRLVNVYGSLLLYTPPLVIVDFGTAITFDYVNTQGIFKGGLIVPGIMTSLNALSNKGALLPKNCILSKPKSFLGHSTTQGMLSGTVFGFASLTDGLIKHFQKRYGQSVKIIMTGGIASFIKRYCKSKTILNPTLTVQSLYCIAMKEINKKR